MSQTEIATEQNGHIKMAMTKIATRKVKKWPHEKGKIKTATDLHRDA